MITEEELFGYSPDDEEEGGIQDDERTVDLEFDRLFGGASSDEEAPPRPAPLPGSLEARRQAALRRPKSGRLSRPSPATVQVLNAVDPTTPPPPAAAALAARAAPLGGALVLRPIGKRTSATPTASTVQPNPTKAPTTLSLPDTARKLQELAHSLHVGRPADFSGIPAATLQRYATALALCGLTGQGGWDSVAAVREQAGPDALRGVVAGLGLLEVAALRGDCKTVRELCKETVATAPLSRAMGLALERGHLDIVRLLTPHVPLPALTDWLKAIPLWESRVWIVLAAIDRAEKESEDAVWRASDSLTHCTTPLRLLNGGNMAHAACMVGATGWLVRMPSAAVLAPDWDGYSPLHYAARHGQVRTVQWLLQAVSGALVNYPQWAANTSGATPLTLAAHYGHTMVVQEFLQRDPFLQRDALLPREVLLNASEFKDVDDIRRNAEEEEEKILPVLEFTLTKEARVVKNCEPDPDWKRRWRAELPEKATLEAVTSAGRASRLHPSPRRGWTELDGFGWHPVCVAAATNQVGVLNALGDTVFAAENADGSRPFHVAAEFGADAAFHWLLSRPSAAAAAAVPLPDSATGERWPLLHWCIRWRRWSLALALLLRGWTNPLKASGPHLRLRAVDLARAAYPDEARAEFFAAVVAVGLSATEDEEEDEEDLVEEDGAALSCTGPLDSLHFLDGPNNSSSTLHYYETGDDVHSRHTGIPRALDSNNLLSNKRPRLD